MNFHDKKAIYLQIADYFYNSILRKKMKANERVLSVRDLAVQTEVNPNTVMRTYSHLQERNIIYNKRGIGYFIADGAFDLALKIKKDEFIKDELPSLFKTLEVLSLSISDIEKMHEEFKKNN